MQLRSGRELTKRFDYPPGHPKNPLSREELERKFRALTASILPPAQIERTIAAVWSLESVEQVSDLMAGLKALE